MKKQLVWIGGLAILVSLLFFFPIFKGFYPFPGDLLLGEYAPYNSYSFLGFAPGGYPNKAQNFDVLRLLYPAKEFSMRLLSQGIVPLWNPYNFSGNPHLASLQSGTFYPFNIIFFLFSFPEAWILYLILQPVLLIFFTVLFLRELALNKIAAFIGGVIFAFSSYMVVWMQYGTVGHSIVWLPLALYLVLKIGKQPNIVTSYILSIVLSFSLLAGYIQTSVYTIALTLAFIAYIVFLKKGQRVKWIIAFLPVFILPFLLAAVQLVPTFELLFNSARTAYSTQDLFQLLIPQMHLVTLFVPDFFGNPATRNYWLAGTYIERVSYVGVVPLLFAVYAVFFRINTMSRFFVIISGFIYIFTFDTPFARAFYSLQIPFLSTAVPSRVMFIFCFSGSVLSACGIDMFLQSKTMKKFLITAIGLSTIYIFIWVFVLVAPILFPSSPWIQHITISKRNLIIPSLIMFSIVGSLVVASKLKLKKAYILFFLTVLMVLDLWYFFHKITPFAPRESIYPTTEVVTELKKIQGIDRMWGYGSAYIDTNIHTHDQIYSTDGYDALHIKRYGELIEASKDGKIPSKASRSTVTIAPGFGESDLRENLFRQKILNLVGVRYVLHKVSPEHVKDFDQATFDPSIYRLKWTSGVFQIYENMLALPRIFLASKYIVEADNKKIINHLFDPGFDARNTVILEGQMTQGFNPREDKTARTVLKHYSENRVVIQTHSLHDSVLFMSDTYFPGWRATVDQEEKKIIRANYAFRALPVEKGTHTIEFIYSPSSFNVGWKISVISYVLCVIVIIFMWSRKRFSIKIRS